MKKRFKNSVSLLLIFALLFTDFAPFLKFLNVKAEAITEGVNLIGVDGEDIGLDLLTNPEVELSLDNDNYSLYCNSTNTSTIDIYMEDDTCTINAIDFGRGTIMVEITNKDNNNEVYYRYYSYDTGMEDYLNSAINRVPDNLYENIDIADYISKLVSDDFNINVDVDYVENKASIELIYTWVTYDGETWDYDHSMRAEKEISLLQPIEMDHIFYLPTLEIGESTQVYFINNDRPDYSRLVWTSDDPEIATVNANGVITGVSPGRTYINVYDRNTKKTSRTDVSVKVDMTLEEKIESLTNYLTGELVIDPADVSNVTIYDFDNIVYEEITRNYLNDYINNLGYDMYLSTVDCTDNACTATIGYWNSELFTTEFFQPSFTVTLRGVYVREMSFDVGEQSSLYYHLFDTNVAPTIEYNNEKLDLVETGDGYYIFEGLKVGPTSVDITSGDYTASAVIGLLPSAPEVTGYLESIRDMELPYNSNEIMSTSDILFLENIISEKVREEYPNDESREYLSVDTKCFDKNHCKVQLGFDIIHLNTSSVWVNLSYTGASSFNLLKERMDALETEYDVTLYDSLVLADECDSIDCIINNAHRYTPLDEMENVWIDVKGFSLLMPYVPSSVTYRLIVEDELGTYTKDVVVNLDYVIDAPVQLEDTEEVKIEFINNFISDKLDKDIESANIGNSKYKIDDNYYIILDKKEAVELISFYPIKPLITIETGKSAFIELGFYPQNSNVYEFEFSINDPSIATITDTGIVTGVSKGFTNATVKYRNSQATILILVDTTIEEHLNSLIEGVPDEVDLDYSDFAYNDLENSIKNAIYTSLYQHNLSFNNMSVELEEREDKYYATIVYTDYSTSTEYTSNEKLINYNIKGIKVDQNKYELEVDDTVDIHLEFSEGDNINVEYRIINPDVISYDNGVITALKPGLATIYFNDKYNEYYNYVKVVVDASTVLYGFSEFLTDKEIILDYVYLSEDGSSLENAFGRAFGKLYYEYFNTYDIIGYSESVSCGTSGDKCTYTMYNESYQAIFNGEFPYTLKGINIDSVRDDIEVNEHLPIDYETVGTDDEVTVTSLDTNICIIENNDIIGVNPGACTIKYDNGEYVNYKHVFVSVDDFEDTLNTALNNLPDEIDIDLEPYVTPEDLGWDMEVYMITISEKLKATVADLLYESDSLNIDVRIDDLETLEDGYADVYISGYYNFYDYVKGVYYYENIAESTDKMVTVTFNGLSDENIEIANTIKETMKSKYELSLTQYMIYRLDIENGTVGNKSLIDYSSFVEELDNICDDCEFRFLGGYGDDDITNPVQGGVLLIYRNGTAITYIELEIRVDISVSQAAGEILTEEEYINRVVTSIKKAYKDAKNANLSIATLLGAYKLLDDEVEVIVEKGFNEQTFKPEYTFTVNNDFKFTASVETKVTGTKTYEAYVTGVNVDKSEINIKVDETSTVIATVTPDNAKNKGVTWTSNNPGIISVDQNGKITGLSVGNGTVTVTTDEGNFSKTVTVHVSAKEVIPDPGPVDQTKLGDVNRDGVINIADLIKLRKFVAGIDSLGAQEQKNADINKDNSVNIVDIVKLRKHLAGLEEI